MEWTERDAATGDSRGERGNTAVLEVDSAAKPQCGLTLLLVGQVSRIPGNGITWTLDGRVGRVDGSQSRDVANGIRRAWGHASPVG